MTSLTRPALSGPALRFGLAALCLTIGTSAAQAQEASNVTPTNAERLWSGAARAGAVASAGDAGGVAAVSGDTLDPIAPQDEEWVGPWGERRSLGAAVGEIVGINILVWSFNEYIRGADFTQVNPRTWWHNIDGGFTYDDNNFNTNMFAHPFHGSLYYNAGRSNGFNYWQSLGFSLFGSLMWECCGETHPPAWNDWIATGVGGAAIGEMTYRVAGTVLDNTATGAERTWREIGAFAINPVRGFNRLVTGRSGRVTENPEQPEDRIPSVLSNRLSAGIRIIGEGESLSDSSETHGLFQVDFKFGDEFEQQRRKPFDVFDMSLQLNLGDKSTLGRVSVRGNLFTTDLKRGGNTQHVFAVEQEFQYMNNNAFEFGGQSLSFMYLKRTERSARTSVTWTASGTWMIMGGVNSEFASLADIAGIRERLREYDFGTGLGAGAGFNLLRDGYRWIEASYRIQHLTTLNGSNLNGQDANHVIQFFKLRAVFPLGYKRFGAGAEYELFLRDSYFSFEGFEKIEQRVPRWQIFFTWNPTRVLN